MTGDVDDGVRVERRVGGRAAARSWTTACRRPSRRRGWSRYLSLRDQHFDLGLGLSLGLETKRSGSFSRKSGAPIYKLSYDNLMIILR